VPKILYGVSPVGLGHATRSLVIAEALRRQGADVRMFSGGRAAEFIRDSGVAVDDIIDDAVPRVVRGEMSRVSLWYVRSWLAQRRNVRRTEQLWSSYSPDIVVCDEEFSGIAVAEKRGKRRAFIADELKLGFARSWFAKRIERRVERWYNKLQATVDLLILPASGEEEGNRRYVGPIVRPTTMTCEDTRKKYGLPEGKMVLVSLSGSGIGRELAEKVVSAVRAGSASDVFVAVTGNRGDRFEEAGVHDLGIVKDNQNLIACADLVVSTAGKSTIDEAQAAGTPIVTIPIRYHAEQERNAAALGYSYANLERLNELVAAKIGRRETPREFRGEQIASRLILSML